MHRLPLVLNTPSLYWNRNMPEHVLFKNTLNVRNIDENDVYMNILESEAVESSSKSSAVAFEDFSKLGSGKNEFEDVCLLNKIIFNAPRDCEALTQSLIIRAKWNLQQCSFQAAINDFEMFLHINTRYDDCEDLCEVYGHLAISFYLLRKYDMTEKYLSSYYNYKAKLPHGRAFINSKLNKINNHISNFEHELDGFVDVAAKHSDSSLQSTPFREFTDNKEMKQISPAFYYIETRNKRKDAGVFSKTDLPKASIILVEKPLSANVNLPLVQCEICLRVSLQAYTCLECRYKTYCSLACIKRDKDIHQHECSAYRNLIILILDAKDLYRLFIQLSHHFHERVFPQKGLRKCLSAEAVLYRIEQDIHQCNSQDSSMFSLVSSRPNYYQLSQTQFSTLVATAFRLTLFVSRKTNIVDTFYKNLRISQNQKIILIGAILMRLHCHLLLNTFDFEYVIPLQEKPRCETVYGQMKEWLNLIKPNQHTNENSIHDYHNTTEAEVVELLLDQNKEDPLQFNTSPIPMICSSIIRPVSTFKDKLTELCFNPDEIHSLIYGENSGSRTFESAMNISIAEMSYMKRCKFVQTFVCNFHKYFMEYFSQKRVRFNRIHQVLSLLCPSLRKLNPSCDPNVDIVVLESGVVMGMTLRNIKKGEELVISYKAHHMRHTREDRQSFLKQISTYCECNACKGSLENEHTDFRFGVYCDNCSGLEITPMKVNCTKCGIKYSTVLLKYGMEILKLEDVLRGLTNPEIDEWRLYLFNTTLYLRAKQYFTPANETRVKSELRYARYLALKNFVQQAYDILMEVKSNISQHYSEDDVWFSFYSELLLVIKIILYYNIDKDSKPMPIFHLEELCKFGIHIIYGQLNHICLFKKYTSHHSGVFEEMQLFLKWRERIHYLSLLHNIPTAESKKNVKKTRENLPGLMKIMK